MYLDQKKKMNQSKIDLLEILETFLSMEMKIINW